MAQKVKKWGGIGHAHMNMSRQSPTLWSRYCTSLIWEYTSDQLISSNAKSSNRNINLNNLKSSQKNRISSKLFRCHPRLYGPTRNQNGVYGNIYKKRNIEKYPKQKTRMGWSCVVSLREPYLQCTGHKLWKKAAKRLTLIKLA